MKEILLNLNRKIVQFLDHAQANEVTSASTIFASISRDLKDIRGILNNSIGDINAFMKLIYLRSDSELLYSKFILIKNYELIYNKAENKLIVISRFDDSEEEFYFSETQGKNIIVNLTVEFDQFQESKIQNVLTGSSNTFEELRSEIEDYIRTHNPMYFALINSRTPERFLFSFLASVFDKLQNSIHLAIGQNNLETAEGSYLELLAKIFLNYYPVPPKPAKTVARLKIEDNKELHNNIEISRNTTSLVLDRDLQQIKIEDNSSTNGINEQDAEGFTQYLGFLPPIEYSDTTANVLDYQRDSNSNLDKFINRLITEINNAIISDNVSSDLTFNYTYNYIYNDSTSSETITSEVKITVPQSILQNISNVYSNLTASYIHVKGVPTIITSNNNYTFKISKEDFLLNSEEALTLLPPITLNNLQITMEVYNEESRDSILTLNINNIKKYLLEISNSNNTTIGNSDIDSLPEYIEFVSNPTRLFDLSVNDIVNLDDFNINQNKIIVEAFTESNERVNVKLLDSYIYSQVLYDDIFNLNTDETENIMSSLERTTGLLILKEFDRYGRIKLVRLPNIYAPNTMSKKYVLKVTYEVHSAELANDESFPEKDTNDLIFYIMYGESTLEWRIKSGLKLIFDNSFGGGRGDTDEDIRNFKNYTSLSRLPLYIDRSVSETDIIVLLNRLKHKYNILNAKFVVLRKSYSSHPGPWDPRV